MDWTTWSSIFTSVGLPAMTWYIPKNAADDFYPTLLVQLRHDCGVALPPDRFQTYGSQPTNRQRNSLDSLFRKTAYLAYQLMRPWRGCYRSHLELEALFWAQYRHLLFFVFPSADNLAKCLPWYRPMPSMFLYDHPGYIDFLLWPQLQEQLKCNWKESNTRGLVEKLIRGFNVYSADIDPEQPQIYIANSELHLSEAFERALVDPSNFCMQPHLFTQSPESARGDSRVVLDPPATGNATCPTHTAGSAFNPNSRPTRMGYVSRFGRLLFHPRFTYHVISIVRLHCVHPNWITG
ncbi:hypothetical protein ASPCADRAFT_135034 [Aspergillus carbonarius ITEM 5010]|uniref:Uncharacterized protein n=1 Tax=Aspergillus carbonarius (strain ITEM 5010) TaxID=602072 RepID=A0A1R3R7V3_ASPC5|nr:hypothetical protein ASPCADRAFT_135034 [Aspergillus carbonarius ITEM 5010]